MKGATHEGTENRPLRRREIGTGRAVFGSKPASSQPFSNSYFPNQLVHKPFSSSCMKTLHTRTLRVVALVVFIDLINKDSLCATNHMCVNWVCETAENLYAYQCMGLSVHVCLRTLLNYVLAYPAATLSFPPSYWYE